MFWQVATVNHVFQYTVSYYLYYDLDINLVGCLEILQTFTHRSPLVVFPYHKYDSETPQHYCNETTFMN